jgi:putative transposase
MQSVNELVPQIGLVAACTALAMNRSFVYRERARDRRSASAAPRVRPRPPLALSVAERQLLLGVLDSERFVDAAPATIFATLLDEGHYHGSVRTMYRLLAANDQTRERRNQRVHPSYSKPELLAVRPNEVWSWDISKIKGPVKWNHYHFHAAPQIMPNGTGFPRSAR